MKEGGWRGGRKQEVGRVDEGWKLKMWMEKGGWKSG